MVCHWGKNARRVTSGLLVLGILAYMVMPEPFSLVLILPPKLRIACEFLLFSFFLALFCTTLQLKEMITPVGMLCGASLWLIMSNPSLTATDGHSTPSLIAKLSVLILGASVVSRQRWILALLVRVWIVLWSLISLQTILSCIAFNFGWVPFSLKTDVFFHPLFGFVNPWNFFGVMVGKPMSYLLEPVALGFCLGLNGVSSMPGLDDKGSRYFRLLNLLAGLCTGSMAFYLFFTLLALSRALHHVFNRLQSKDFVSRNREVLTVMALVVFAVTFLVLTRECTSIQDRLLRLAIGLDALFQTDWRSLFFGNLHYVAACGIPGAECKTISSGFLTVLVQRGVPLFLFLGYLLYRYARDSVLLLSYLLFYGWVLQYFWWPVFIVFLIMHQGGSGRCRV